MDFYASRAQVGKSGMEFFQFLLDGCWLAAVYPNSHEDAVMCTVWIDLTGFLELLPNSKCLNHNFGAQEAWNLSLAALMEIFQATFFFGKTWRQDETSDRSTYESRERQIFGSLVMLCLDQIAVVEEAIGDWRRREFFSASIPVDVRFLHFWESAA